MKDAWIDENSTKLATLEEFISFSEEDVIRIKHDDSVIVHQAPCIEFV